MTIRNIVPWKWGKHRWESEDDQPLGGLASQMDSLHRDIDRLFEDMWRGRRTSSLPETLGRFEFLPQVDETEDDKAYYVNIELPGMDENDVDVKVTDRTLTIKGEKKEEDEQKGKDYFRRERSYGGFQRILELPGEVDQSEIDASFKKGVLRVTLPKTKEAREKVKQIPVRPE